MEKNPISFTLKDTSDIIYFLYSVYLVCNEFIFDIGRNVNCKKYKYD